MSRAANGPAFGRTSTVLVVAAFALVLGGVGGAWHYALPDPGTSQPVIRLYAGAEPIGEIYPTHKAQNWVQLERFPRPVIDAVLVAEDRRFWAHLAWIRWLSCGRFTPICDVTSYARAPAPLPS